MSLWSTIRNLPTSFLARLKPGSPGRDFLLEEKILATLRVYGNRVRFLPSVDQVVEETTDMRLAYRQMLREPAVKAPLLQKILSVAQNEIQVHAASQRPIDKIASDFVHHCMIRAKGTTRRMALSVLLGGLMDGYSVCEKVWQIEDRGPWAGKIILKQLKAKDTRYAHLEGDQFRNVLYVRDTRNNLRYHADNFVVWQHLPIFENPTGWSDFRSAYRAYWLMDTSQKLRAIGLERFALPVIKGTYEDPEQRDSLENAIQNLRSLGWVSLPAGAQIEALDLATRSQPEFTAAIQDLRQEMFLAIAGAMLQSLQGTTTDGRGNSETHQDTAELLTWFLAAELGDVISESVVRDLIDMNFAEADYPTVTFGSVSDETLMASLNIDKGLQEMGLPLSKEEMYQKYGRQAPTTPEDTLTAPAQAQGQTGPGGTTYSLPGGQFAEEERLTVKPGPAVWGQRSTLPDNTSWVGFSGDAGTPQWGNLQGTPGPGSDLPWYTSAPATWTLPDRAEQSREWQWIAQQDATGFDAASPRQQLDQLAQLILGKGRPAVTEFCGGPGSGKPGPCPEGGPDHNASSTATTPTEPAATVSTPRAVNVGRLEGEIKQLQQTPQGQAALQKGAGLASKAAGVLKAGVQKIAQLLDGDSLGAGSALVHALGLGKEAYQGGKWERTKDIYRASNALFRSIYTNVHQEVFENALAMHTGLTGAHAIGKIAAKGAAAGEGAALKAAAWAMGKMGLASHGETTAFAEGPQPNQADLQVILQLGQLARQVLAGIYQATGAQVQLPTAAQLGQKIFASLQQGGQSDFCDSPPDENRLQGMIARVQQANPSLTAGQVRAILTTALNEPHTGSPAAGGVSCLGTPPGVSDGGPPSAAAVSPTKHDDKGGSALSGATFPVTSDVASTGAHADQKKAEQLLAASLRAGVATLSDVSASAFARLLQKPDPQNAGRFFDTRELARLTETLAAINSTADLLGRSRIQLRADEAKQGTRKFADSPTTFARFDDAPLSPMQPSEAIDYFTSLVPTLGVDPVRFGELMQRHAFTMAAAADETMLARAKQILAQALTSGQGTGSAHLGIQDLLDQAGVSPRNPQYAQMVVRTNLMDSFNHGAQEQLVEHADTFPVWRYEGIRDGRQGKDHEPHFGKYFDAKRSFAEVRGKRPYNCRCTFVPIHKDEWQELQAGGAQVSRFSDDQLIVENGKVMGVLRQEPDGGQMLWRPGQAPVFINSFAADDVGGRWITIGGSKGEDGKRHGGSPVFIKDGKITKGAPGLTGKKLDNLKGDADSTHRKDLAREKEYQRAVWSKKAKKAGHNPEDLHGLADEIEAHDAAHVEQRKKLLKDARELLTKQGYHAGALTTNLRSGAVEDNIPGLDLVARTMASRYPEQFAGHLDTTNGDVERLKDLLTEGNPQAMGREAAYEKALEQLDAMKASQPEEDFPFDAIAPAAAPAKTETAPTFTTKEDAAAAAAQAHATHGQWAENLSEDQRDALTAYIGSAYHDINEALRAGQASTGDRFNDAAIKHLDQIIASAPPLPHNAILYRGVGPQISKQLQPGATFEDKGFVSTSSNRHFAEGFVDDALIEVHVPKGTRAAAVDALTTNPDGSQASDFRWHKSENEYVLPRGSKFKVTGRRRGPGGSDVITVELVS